MLPPQPTSDLKSSNLLFMLQTKILTPSPMELKILTELNDNIPKLYRPHEEFKLAFITIYNDRTVFEGRLTGKSIAKQLSWNAQSMNTLLECLKGKRDKVQTKFFPVSKDHPNSTYNFEMICEIGSGINLTLFSVQLQQSKIPNPFLHMKQKFSSLERTFRQRQRGYKQKQEQLKGELNQIEAVQKQILYSSTTEISLMKKQFIKHVNKEKAKIRKLMGSVPMINPVSGMIENRGVGGKELGRILQKEGEEDELQRTESMKKHRDVKKVDREKYSKPMPQKLQQQYSRQQQQKYFSESSSIRQPANLKRQKPEGQKWQKRLGPDGDSSSEEGNNEQGQGNEDGKTFLELERERREREKQLNKGQEIDQDVWDDLLG